jgi:hypothetical protein
VKLTLAILLNLGLLAVVLPWLRRQWHATAGWWHGALLLGLGTRLGLGWWSSQHLIKDARWMNVFSHALYTQFWDEPAGAWRTLLGDELHFGPIHKVYYGMSNTFFLTKVLAFLNLGSMGFNALNAIYLSLFCFVGCWQLARTMARVLPHTPAGAALVGFVLWPSVLFWATGITKESVLLGSGAWLTALFIELFWGGRKTSRQTTGLVLGLLFLAVVHFKMRYFFAVPLLGALLGLTVVRVAQQLGLARRRIPQALVLAAVLGGGIWLGSEVSVAFRVNKFTHQVVRIYEHHRVASAGRPHFEYPNLRPTLESIAAHAPLAVVNALSRPWLGESFKPQYLASGLENAALLMLLVVAAVAAVRGKPGRLPFLLGLGLLVHCVALAVLLGLSTPNLGSLNRYRSDLLPFLLLLLLQNDYANAALRRVGLGRPNDAV